MPVNEHDRQENNLFLIEEIIDCLILDTSIWILD